MKITKTLLRQIIKEELEKFTPRNPKEIEAEERFVNAALNFQKFISNAKMAKILREMADSVELGR
ncbi:MAG TPA: hypothetical protein DCX27_19400 [Balneola sp.]|nr:hypothetical protein [Balneola sp.]